MSQSIELAYQEALARDQMNYSDCKECKWFNPMSDNRLKCDFDADNIDECNLVRVHLLTK